MDTSLYILNFLNISLAFFFLIKFTDILINLFNKSDKTNHENSIMILERKVTALENKLNELKEPLRVINEMINKINHLIDNNKCDECEDNIEEKSEDDDSDIESDTESDTESQSISDENICSESKETKVVDSGNKEHIE